MLDIFRKFQENNEFVEVGKVLGRGTFGVVREIKYKNKVMAGKLIRRENEEKSEEEKYAMELRGHNIIKINKIYSKEIGNNFYDLIIMEKAVLRDLGKLSEFYHRHNLLKLMYQPFNQVCGDFLLRFYTRQIINALELLDRNYYVHFDIKPENLLMNYNLTVKLSDFSLLRKAKDGNIRIPGGTPGFTTPEYYVDRNVSCEVARKQDYFALGATLYFLKYGEQMLKYKKSDDKIINHHQIINLLQKHITRILSEKTQDQDFNEFLLGLINYSPKDRFSFEQIYRNKWLNKDIESLNDVVSTFENDEEKLIMELQKKDYLIKKEKELNEELNLENDNDIKILKDNLRNEIKNDKKEKPCRFRFKKKKKVQN